MIVGDGQGLVKTKVVDRVKGLTVKQNCLFESESVNDLLNSAIMPNLMFLLFCVLSAGHYDE